MRRNPRVVGEEGAELPVAVLGRVSIVLVVVVGEVVVGNERGGIATDGDGVALHRRIGGSAAEGGRVPELRHAPIGEGVSCLSLLIAERGKQRFVVVNVNSDPLVCAIHYSTYSFPQRAKQQVSIISLATVFYFSIL